MCEGLWVHATRRPALDCVITDRFHRRHRFRDISSFQDAFFAIGIIRPDAHQAVRLQPHFHLDRIHFLAGGQAFGLLHFL